MTWTADELTSIREWSEDWMPDSVRVLRNSGTINAIGGRTLNWGTVGTISCRIRPAKTGTSGSEQLHQDAVAAESRWEIVVPEGSDILREDRVIVITSGKRYDVVDINDAGTDRMDMRLDCVHRA